MSQKFKLEPWKRTTYSCLQLWQRPVTNSQIGMPVGSPRKCVVIWIFCYMVQKRKDCQWKKYVTGFSQITLDFDVSIMPLKIKRNSNTWVKYLPYTRPPYLMRFWYSLGIKYIWIDEYLIILMCQSFEHYSIVLKFSISSN